MEELQDIFNNRFEVRFTTLAAKSLHVQEKDDNGNIVTHEEQIELAKNELD
uniref:Uncharacterized protein n=1 Tax=Klebsiella phage FKP3 TaxID=3231233 RepID=A0AAU8I020_9CAUD